LPKCSTASTGGTTCAPSCRAWYAPRRSLRRSTKRGFGRAETRRESGAIECKWDPGAFDSTALQLLHGHYPNGRNFLVTPSGDPGYDKRFGKLEQRVCTPSELKP
jgi:hypothetical protein